MEKNSSNKRITFILPEDIVLTDVIFEILKNNGLEESEEEAVNKSIQGKDSRLIIIRDAAISIVQKKVPEKKLIELLEKHLGIQKHAAEKIVNDIKQKLIPYAKIVEPIEEKEIMQKPSEPKPEIKIDRERVIPYAKKIEIKNVEENAKKIRGDKKFSDAGRDVTEEETKKFGQSKFVNEKKGPDDYRESIDQE